MKHVFRTTEVKEVSQPGVQFTPSNALGYSELSKWPDNVKANEVKKHLNKEHGLTIYLIDPKGTLITEVDPQLLKH